MSLQAVYRVRLTVLGAESETFIHRQPVPLEPAGAALYAKSAARREISARLRAGEQIAALDFVRFETGWGAE